MDLGLPLGNGKTITRGSVKESSATIAGYSILQADSVDVVTELLKDHPHLPMPNFSIEVFEGMPTLAM